MAEAPSSSDVVSSRHQLDFVFRGASSCKSLENGESALEGVSAEDNPTILYQSLSENFEDLIGDSEGQSFLDANGFAEYCGTLIRRVVVGDLGKDECIQRLQPHLDAYPGLATLIVDELQIAEYSTAESEDNSAIERYSDLVTQIVSKNVVPIGDARERLEQEMLLAVGVADKGSSWETRYVRTKTKWFFKLQKFNLYREESEGFAELIDVLDQASAANSSLITEKILELAGTYDLDIYRIVETMLTAICLQPKVLSKVLLEFCDNVDFDMATLIALVGGKFQLDGKKSGQEFRRIRGLCQLVCHIVSEGLASWDDVIPYVPLSRQQTELHWKQMFERAVAEEQVLHTTKRSVKEQFSNMTNVSFHAMSQYFEENRNPRIDLITVMLQNGMCRDAVRLINEMPIQYATTFEPLALEIAKIVHYIIDPLYRSIGLDAQLIPDSDPNLPTVLRDQLPYQLTNAVDMTELLDPWLMLLGGNVVYDRTLLTKLVRLAHEFVKLNEVAINQDLSLLDVSTQKILSEFLHIFEHCVLPGLTRGIGSSALSENIFAVLKMLPYTIRFTLYYKMKEDFYPNGHPLGIVARAIALANAKWFQKRINKDNTKLCGRMVAKDMYNNAIIVCHYLAERIGSYDNFGTLVTEAMRNASAFAADVMLCCVLEYMTAPKNNNHKHDAMTIMPWYRYTATFSAVFAKRTAIELEPILEYVVGMLKAGQTVDLLILKELVHKLSGIEISEGVTDEQLEALAGGEVLKAEGAYFSPMRNTKRSSIRLKDALLKSGQALPLCLLISHVESVILYREDEGKNLKLVGLLYDMCHDTLVQYGTFLATNLTKTEYADNFPTLAELIRVYNIPFETSIFLLRSVYWNEISTKIEDFKKEQGIPDGTLSEEHFKLVQEKFSKTFDNVISSVVDLIAPVMTQAPMEDISLRFYVLFWFLSLYDLYVPTAVYEQEVEKLQQVVALAHADQGDDDINTVYKRKKEGQRAQTVITRLQEEMSVQKQHVLMLRNHLTEEKDRWFQSAKSNKSDVVSQFLQMCVLPRATFSTIDALFSAHFISCLHELRTQNFSTLLCYDRMLCDITTALTCCSENEASRYGRLLHTVLQTIMRWHNSKSIFEAECQHHPGFMTKFRTPTVSAGADVVDHIDYENFRHVCHKWHFKLTKSMVKSLDSDSYVRIRNGLIVLDRILPYYPIISNFYIAIEKRVQQLMDSEKVKRPDMYSLAYGYMGRLRTQKASGHLVVEDSFHTKAGLKKESLKADKNEGMKDDVTLPDTDFSHGLYDTSASHNSALEKDKDVTDSSRKLLIDSLKAESVTKKVDSFATKTPAIPFAKPLSKTGTTIKSTDKAALESEAISAEKDVAPVKKPRISSHVAKVTVESPLQNGTVTNGDEQSANGVKVRYVGEKLVVAKEQAEKVAKRMEKNGVKPESNAKESKKISRISPPTSMPDPARASQPRKIPPSVSDNSKSVNVAPSPKPEKEATVIESRIRTSIREERKEKKQSPRSPDAKVVTSSKRQADIVKEKDKDHSSRPSSSSSQSPASRKSTDRSRAAKKEILLDVLSVAADLTPDFTPAKLAGVRSGSKEVRHKQRSGVEIVNREVALRPEKKHSPIEFTKTKSDKAVAKTFERVKSPETTGRRTKSPDTTTRRPDERRKESHKSLHSRESSREQDKKSDRSHPEPTAPGRHSESSATSRPAKRRRDTDESSAERDRPHRKSSTAH